MTGCTVNISKCGALIVTDDQQSFQPGARIEAVIEWPVEDREDPLELKVWGNVAWFRERLIGVHTLRHVLRIAKQRRVAASEPNAGIGKGQSA